VIRVSIKAPIARYKLNTKALIRNCALAVVTAIKRRTDNGIGYDGRLWNYDTDYAAWKRAQGRNPGSKGDWLRLSGQLMGSSMANEKFKLTSNDGRLGVISFFGEHVPYGERFLSAKTKRARARMRKFNTPIKQRKRKEGSASTKPLSNSQLAYYLNKKFRFFGLNEPEKARAIANARKQLAGKLLQRR
jgi:hypothetical protein